MASVVLVSKAGVEFSVSSVIAFVNAVYASGAMPKTGSVRDNYEHLQSAAPPPTGSPNQNVTLAQLQDLLADKADSPVLDNDLPARLSEVALKGAFVASDATTLVPDKAAGEWGVNVEDSPTNQGIPLHLDHRGTGNGFDVRNRPGSGQAVVVHQYANGTGVRLDNTGTGTMLLVAQTNNPTLNPESAAGTAATGDAFRQVDHEGNTWVRLNGRGALILTPPATSSDPALDISHSGTTAISHRVARINNTGVGVALEVNQGANAPDSFAIIASGRKYAGSFTTTQSGGQTLFLSRTNTTGSGDVLVIRNDSASGRSVVFRQATTEVAEITRTGEYENKINGAGIVLRSPNGTRYRVAVADNGTLSATPA